MKLTIDLLPRGAWGNNFSRLLLKKDWDILRNACYARAGNQCTVCGKGGDLDAHEIWDFDIPSRTQTLVDIVALCPACHGVKHMRNSERIGYGEQAKAHFLKINKCSEVSFVSHRAVAESLFKERNEVLRWKMKANLEKFGGKGIEVKKRVIPIIANPYENIDWETINHVKLKDAVNLLSNEDTEKNVRKVKESYHIKEDVIDSSKCPFPPKINAIAVDNYKGQIAISSDYTDKILCVLDDKIIKTKYNIGGRFHTNFCVEDLTGDRVGFILSGNGGEAFLQPFQLLQES